MCGLMHREFKSMFESSGPHEPYWLVSAYVHGSGRIEIMHPSCPSQPGAVPASGPVIG